MIIRNTRVVHALLGNDTAPWTVAFARGLLEAVLTGGIAFFGIWSQTDDIRLLITAGMVPFLSVLSLRFAAEGLVAAGMGGAVQAVLIFVPIPDAQKVELMTALGPGVILLSYVLFGFLDQHTKGGKG